MATSSALGQRMARAAAAFVAAHGDATTVNGASTPAVWRRAQPGRVQMYLAETAWQSPVYLVTFGATVLAAPYSLANGMDLVWQPTGWKGVARSIDVKTVQGIQTVVTALVWLEVGS